MLSLFSVYHLINDFAYFYFTKLQLTIQNAISLNALQSILLRCLKHILKVRCDEGDIAIYDSMWVMNLDISNGM